MPDAHFRWYRRHRILFDWEDSKGDITRFFADPDKLQSLPASVAAFVFDGVRDAYCHKVVGPDIQIEDQRDLLVWPHRVITIDFYVPDAHRVTTADLGQDPDARRQLLNTLLPGRIVLDPMPADTQTRPLFLSAPHEPDYGVVFTDANWRGLIAIAGCVARRAKALFNLRMEIEPHPGGNPYRKRAVIAADMLC